MNEIQLYVTAPCNGGLFDVKIRKETTVDKITTGNIRGITKKNSEIFFANGDTNAIHSLNSVKYKLPEKGSIHDLKYCKNADCFYVMAPEHKKIFKIDFKSGEILNELNLDSSYWPNCCLQTLKNEIIVFLSSKRTSYKSKIICLKNNFEKKWECYCNEGDEIHSPFLVDDNLYWCISNRNMVVKASVSKNLKNVKRIIINNEGYTRGLLIHKNMLILGTSENRHAETTFCNSKTNQGCIHFYKIINDKNIYSFEKTIKLETKEIYDIIC